MSIYSTRSAAAGQGVQPWMADIAIGRSIFDYYSSLGDTTISTPTSIPCVQDGPMAVARYANLTVSAQLTTRSRCRGLLLLVDGNLTVQSGGSISMTARGAVGNAQMTLYDVAIPDRITISSANLSQRDALGYLRTNGHAIIDRWMWDEWGKYLGVTSTAWTGGQVLLSAIGRGSGGGGYGWVGGCGHAQGTVGGSGNGGAAGTSGGTGGGGGGGGASYASPSSGSDGSSGLPWGGGSGGAGSNGYTSMAGSIPDLYGGKGGLQSWPGAGNPAGDNSSSGTGGILIIIVKGAVTVNSGGVIEADGVQAPAGGNAAGGSSGGGHVSIIYAGTLTNNGTIRAGGGASRTGSYGNGGAGGAGSVVTKSFSQMGW